MSRTDYCSMQSRYEENRFNMIWRGGKSFGTFAVEFISWRRHRVLVFFLTQPRPTTYTILISNHIKHTHTQKILLYLFLVLVLFDTVRIVCCYWVGHIQIPLGAPPTFHDATRPPIPALIVAEDSLQLLALVWIRVITELSGQRVPEVGTR